MRRLALLALLLLGGSAFADVPQRNKFEGSIQTSSGDFISTVASGGTAFTFRPNASYASGTLLVVTDGATTRLAVAFDGSLRFFEPSSGGSNYTAIIAQTQAGNIVYTLPASSVDGYLRNTSNAWSWSATIPGSDVSGAVATATALAANGSNCTAGSYATGVDASGNAEGCTPAAGGTVTGSGVAGQIAFWASGSALAGDTDITWDGTTRLSVTDLTVTNTIIGSVSGNAGTATALAANGANCVAGSAAAGVDASGAAESCIDPIVSTEIDTCSELAAILTGQTTGSCGSVVLSTAPTFATSITVPLIKPASDSTTAVQVTKADGTTNVVTVDTTNTRVGIGGTPDWPFHLKTASAGVNWNGNSGIDVFFGVASNTGNYTGLGFGRSANTSGNYQLQAYKQAGAAYGDLILNPQSGNVSIGTTNATNIFNLGGNAARKFWMERNTTSNTAGNGLTVQAGGATSGATNKSGGNLTLVPGTSTGSGTGSVVIQAMPGTAASTSDNTPVTSITAGPTSVTIDGNLDGTTDATVTSGTVTAATFAGALSGNAATSTALAANGGNCASTQAAIGVDASGAAEGCWTPVSGTGTTNTIPLWTNGASGVTGDSNISQVSCANYLGCAGPGTPELSPITNFAGNLGDPTHRWASIYVSNQYAGPGAFTVYTQRDDEAVETDKLTFPGGAVHGFQTNYTEYFQFLDDANTGNNTKLCFAQGVDIGKNTCFQAAPSGVTSATYTFPVSGSVGVLHNDGSNVWSWVNRAGSASDGGAASSVAANSVALTTDTTGDYVASVATTSPLSGGAAGSEGATLTLSIANAAADGTTKGAASFTANDFDATTGNVSIDYTNGQAADASHKGFLTSADWSTFNGKQAAVTAGRSLTFSGATLDADAELYTFSKSIVVYNPSTGDTNKIQTYFPTAVTLARVACSTDTGTVTIQFDERAEATPNTAGTDSMTSTLACDSDSQTTTSFSDAAIAADVPWNLQVTATSGSPTVVRIHVRYTHDD